MRTYFAAGLFFLLLSMAVNAVVVSRFITRQLRGSLAFAEWFEKNTSMGSFVFFLSVTGLDSLQARPCPGVPSARRRSLLHSCTRPLPQLLSCKVLDSLSAPLMLDHAELQIHVLGFVGNFLEDIPQLIVMILVNDRRGGWSSSSQMSFTATICTLIYGGERLYPAALQRSAQTACLHSPSCRV
jgi:hypothetical protein